MKPVKVTLLAVMMVFLVAATAAAGTIINMDGKVLQFEVDPVVENNRTLVPLRDIFEAMGAQVSWDDKSQTARAVKGDITVVLPFGSNRAMINGKAQQLEAPAQLVKGRILVPLRFVAETFGGTVNWDQAKHTINITKAKTANQSQTSLHVGGDKCSSVVDYSLSDLQAMKDIIISENYYSRGKAKENWSAAAHNEFTGVSLAGLLEKKVGLKGIPSRVKIKAEDGYNLILSWDEVKASYIDETNPDQQLKIMLAWSMDGQKINQEGGNSLRLIIGQKYKGDYNRQRWVNYVESITIE